MKRQQQEVISYLREENRILRETLGYKRILIHDRAAFFTKKFRDTLRAPGVRALKLPRQSPNLNPVAESFVRNISRECLNRMLLFGERHVRYVINQYVEHYLIERPHRGLGNVRITKPDAGDGPVLCRERLGGLLKSYYRGTLRVRLRQHQLWSSRLDCAVAPTTLVALTHWRRS